MRFSRIVFILSLVFATLAHAAPTKKLGKELYFAALSQDSVAAKELIGKGADVNHMENGRPILGWAAQNGNVEIVDILLQAGADPNLADTGVGHTPLMRAIDMQFPEIVKALLKGKANPNAKTHEGKSCLTFAIGTKKKELVDLLLAAGADAKYIDSEGNSAVLTTVMDNLPESVEILKSLAKAGAPLNTSNAAYTPLLYALQQDNKPLINALLEVGADPNAPSSSGQTPIGYAIDYPELLSLLLAAKGDPNKPVSTGGDTPLISAIRSGQVDSVKKLLEAGADTNIADPSGQSPLEIAKYSGRPELVTLLDKSPAATESSPPETVGGYKVYSNEPRADGKCTISDAAIKQMELHGKLQAQVNAGKMSDNIFRTFNDDTEEFGDLLTQNPPEACALIERLAKKYGVQ